MAEEGSLDGARVLVVEDEFLIADDLAHALRRVGGGPIGPVPTVDEAERLVRSKAVDAAIVDVNLRGQMASDFVRRLAATGVPCLIVSGYDGGGLPESVSGIPRLEKPVSPALVIEVLAAELVRVS